MIEVTEIVSSVDGWMLAWRNTDNPKSGGSVHIDRAWLDDMYLHQIRPRQAVTDSRYVAAVGEPEFHRLRHAVLSGSQDALLVADLFVQAFGALTKNRQDRANLGLKAVTRDGDEDLRAVADGAPVRPWNSAQAKGELHEWMKEKRASNRHTTDTPEA